MLSFLDELRDFSFMTVLFRLTLALAGGCAIGYGRTKMERAAGMRTYMLISIGAAMSVLLTLYQYEMLTNGAWAAIITGMGFKYDGSRLASQTITGIGFLGAGIIIKAAHQQVNGLTTSTGLWTTGIIGLSIGSAYYEIGIIGTILVLLTETYFATISGKIQKNPTYAIELLYNDKDSLDEVLRLCKDKRLSIVNLQIQSLAEGEAKYAADVTLRGTYKCSELLKSVHVMPGIKAAVEK